MDEKDFERAAELEQMERQTAIDRARSHIARMPPPNFDGSCPECGVDIPAPRISAGYYVCVDCVEEAEYLARLGIKRGDRER